jgi:hypothetical protein
MGRSPATRSPIIRASRSPTCGRSWPCCPRSAWSTRTADPRALPCNIRVGPEHCAIREVFLEVKLAVERILSTSLADLVARQKEIVDRRISVPHDVLCDAPSPLLRILTE